MISDTNSHFARPNLTSISAHNTHTLTLLRRRWLFTATLYASILFGIYLYLQPHWLYATQWAALSTLIMAYHLWMLWSWLPDNHRKGEPTLLPTFGLGNSITLARGLALTMTAGFIFSPWPEGALAWWPTLLYWAALFGDYFDGYFARRANHSTIMGAKLDMEFDSLGIWVVILLSIWYGQLPWWYVSVALARYLFVFTIWFRKQLGWAVYEIHPSAHRRLFAGSFMALMTIALWPIVPIEGLRLAGLMFFTPLMLGFARDWLVVIGYIDPATPSYRKVQHILYVGLAKWGVLLLRIALFVAMVMIYRALSPSAPLALRLLQPPVWVDLVSNWHAPMPWAAMIASFVAISGLLTTAMTTLGIVGRVSAMFLLVAIGFDIAVNGLQVANTIALISACGIGLLDTGYFSLWMPKIW